MVEDRILDDHLTIKTFTLEKKIRDIWFKLSSIFLSAAFLLLYTLAFLIIYLHIDEPIDDTKSTTIFEDIVYTSFLISPIFVFFSIRYLVRKIKFLEKSGTVAMYAISRFAYYSSHIVITSSIVVNILCIIIPFLNNEFILVDWEDYALYIYIFLYIISLIFFYHKIYNYLPILTRLKEDKI